MFCRSWAEECAVRHELYGLCEANCLEACVGSRGSFAAPVQPEGVEYYLCMM